MWCHILASLRYLCCHSYAISGHAVCCTFLFLVGSGYGRVGQLYTLYLLSYVLHVASSLTGYHQTAYLAKKKFLIYCLFHMVYFNEWSRLLLFMKSAFDLNWITISNYLAIINAWELCFWLWLIYAFDLNIMPFIKYIIFHLQIRRLLLVCMAWIAWPVW